MPGTTQSEDNAVRDSLEASVEYLTSVALLTQSESDALLKFVRHEKEFSVTGAVQPTVFAVLATVARYSGKAGHKHEVTLSYLHTIVYTAIGGFAHGGDAAALGSSSIVAVMILNGFKT